ncbi:MAG: hypothetical protein Q8L37_05325 [Candidatus Gottesmanbacteria bacterium]|nr:hypothetical protein [Candidatus Gottesmanbacteria bacterium]
MTGYYRDQVTQKSWNLLTELAKNYSFVLIGGWAVWLYTHALKSKDIDIVVSHSELGKLGKDFPLIKNDRLKKYEINEGDVQVDIYSPFYSNPGIPAQTILDHAVKHEGFMVPRPEDLLSLKLTAYTSRAGSSKGRKDLVDMVSLLRIKTMDWNRIPAGVLAVALRQTEIPELSFNRHEYARLKSEWKKKIAGV